MESWHRRLFQLPRTLRWQLFLILFAGLAVAHVLSFGVLFLERYTAAKTMMLGNLEKDVGISLALLDRLPAGERHQWIATLERGNYRYELGPGLPGVPELSGLGKEVADIIQTAVGQRLPVTIETIPGVRQRVQAHVTLSDGSQVTIDLRPRVMPLASWLPYVLLAQLALLLLCTYIAVRSAIRPLHRLAMAAEALDPSKEVARLDETGPAEVAYAATAFNTMQDRITHYLKERVQILAAISHDLQTPITRMKLRAEVAEDGPGKEKLLSDLSEIERLVREGVAYARTAHGNVEKPARIDVGSFVESIVSDYQDTGKAVKALQTIDAVVTTRPHALRRILTNLIDNALKFAGEAEVDVGRKPDGKIYIVVLDRGPGIPDGQLEAVLQPFYRLEQSRNRDTGGTGLGLAIAQQLALAIDGSLNLKNRSGGGLAAEIVLG
ncbi:HAMP domain-containing sensor histidine kinase [Microvirga sp. VF16]|uniref:sensor histidine kinase n=1 Tax=Microvirga sp. VF16 TaxID=2807101 RepID=UPI00193DC016|nr:HAMP domain-containing sensor histidine kinase [Microvirga sp. VF16]QRM33733.1 HAMP domain-containing histidine kinase [Microvirga sp. VF16]